MIFKKICSVLLCLFFVTTSLYANYTPNVWDVLRKQLNLNHEITQAQVHDQLRWLISHPSYIQKLTQSEPYIYHIVNEIKQRHLPGELALIPMLESTYDPFAYSGSGAAGLWQFMPRTANDLGLKQDWWFDARRSIRPSTDAALNYLSYLNKYFNGNWLLAIAAYDAGEGTISKAIKNSNQSRRITFWKLPLPNETKMYIPRLLALAEIIKYPKRYHVNLPDIPHTPYFQEVNVGTQIDLSHAARLAGMSYQSLIKLNPGHNRGTLSPHRPFKLLIPINKVARFNQNLSNMPSNKSRKWIKYQVKARETLVSIAAQHTTTPQRIIELNHLKNNKLKPGQYVLIPQPTRLITKSPTLQTQVRPIPIKKNEYIIISGDNLSTIAKRFHTNIAKLKKLNPSLHPRLLKPGQRVIIS